jgi:hypothetical protein
MPTNIFYTRTSAADSEPGDFSIVPGEWLVFTAVVLLTAVVVLCAANIGIDPTLMWPEPSLVGP